MLKRAQQSMINSKSEYRNTKQIQISNAQMIEALRSDRKEFCLIQIRSLTPWQDLSASSSRVATGLALAFAVQT